MRCEDAQPVECPTALSGLRIRRFSSGDETVLMRVFASAVHQVAARDYSPEQVDAWAPPDMDADLWAARMRHIQPFVAVWGGEIVGYADVQPNGYSNHFFVSGAHTRRGIGSRLMSRIHDEARSLGLCTLTADVSLTAEPFFADHGFNVVERQWPVCRGVTLQNARMRKDLGCVA